MDPLRGSADRASDGNTYCHPSAYAAAGYLRGQREREPDGAASARDITCVNFQCAFNLLPQCGKQRGWKHGDPVLEAFAVPDNDRAALEVDILHAQAAAFHDAQTGAVEQAAENGMNAPSGARARA